MDPVQQYLLQETRRHFFRRGAMGLGTAALASLLSEPLSAATKVESKATGGLPGLPHFAPKAKRAIYLFMAGAPCQMDMLDYKPKLVDKFQVDLKKEKYQDGSPVLRTRVTTMTSGQATFPIAPSKFKFTQHGQSGTWVSELLPHTAKMVDDIAIIRSMWTEAINHDPAITYINTGNQLPGLPSLGAWLSYGLGTENANLPTFMVMTPYWSGRKEAQALYNRLWGSGFLASKYQGVALRSSGDPVLFLSNPPGVEAVDRRRVLDAVAQLNSRRHEVVGDPEIRARIAQYEMAYRMQTSVPQLTNVADEPKHVLDMYGPEVTKPGSFAASCLLARRMMERDVRFVQIFHRGWDQHFNVAGDLPKQCQDIDQPCWALIQDLKQRSLLDDTLVIWGGEFGRTVYSQGKLSKENYGRDHHPGCFTIWMAGGGVKGGVVHGETDDWCCNIVDSAGQPTDKFADGAVHIRDLNATILHQLGIDHRRLSVKFQGLDQRLTGVEEAHVVRPLLS
ncbi:MAG: DUF1501 domain-containing protein [Planctomycetota bacterium]|nr:DUF1501 domain-containing protein [Planctomycetota bacterium]